MLLFLASGSNNDAAAALPPAAMPRQRPPSHSDHNPGSDAMLRCLAQRLSTRPAISRRHLQQQHLVRLVPSRNFRIIIPCAMKDKEALVQDFHQVRPAAVPARAEAVRRRCAGGGGARAVGLVRTGQHWLDGSGDAADAMPNEDQEHSMRPLWQSCNPLQPRSLPLPLPAASVHTPPTSTSR